jgi:hypothetical protein
MTERSPEYTILYKLKTKYMYVKSKVVMLQVKEKVNGSNIIVKNEQFNSLGFGYGNGIKNAQHLYFISDKKIREGDTFIYSYDNNNSYLLTCLIITDLIIISQERFNVGDISDWNKKYCKKVIASTNPSLNLPKPLQSFINKYITEYNKGNIIEEVMIEYEEYHGLNQSIAEIYAVSESDNGNDYNKSFNFKLDSLGREYKIKVDKQNTITIKPIKSSWNRDEVIKLLRHFENDLYSKFYSNNMNTDIRINKLNEFINNNL